MQIEGGAGAAPLKKKEVIKTYDDMIDKPAFYEKYDLIKRL